VEKKLHQLKTPLLVICRGFQRLQTCVPLSKMLGVEWRFGGSSTLVDEGEATACVETSNCVLSPVEHSLLDGPQKPLKHLPATLVPPT
jgi:hypothetical protein